MGLKLSVSPPRPKPLHLTALRAFEAAARLGGFAAAADELGVSPGAVSAHIKALEEEIGVALFKRTARGVLLTASGHRTLPAFSEAFDRMGEAVQALRSEASPAVVHIATLPAVAQFWLSPRLPALRAATPEIDISITAMERPPNLKRTTYDLCLFFGNGIGETVARDRIFPVCAPSLAARLSAPVDLATVPCLTDTTWSGDWGTWISVACPEAGFVPRGPVFSLYSLAVEETVNGAGVLMGHEALLTRHLSDGTLVAPFDPKLSMPETLRLWSLRPVPAGAPIRQVVDGLTRSA